MASISFYCPDRHIEYDGLTPDGYGIGGGITSRIRLGASLASRGHAVTSIVNCRQPRVIDGVRYLPLDTAEQIEADLLIANTSGGDMDLSPIGGLRVQARTKVLWVSGVAEPNGLEELAPDALCAKSNFLLHEITSNWSNQTASRVVIYNGYVKQHFEVRASSVEKDLHAVAYTSHPEKGLDQAVRVVRELRSEGTSHRLFVLGTEALWGQDVMPRTAEDGIDYGGMVPQSEVAQLLLAANFSFCLQSIREGFGLTLLESLRAGCCVIASSVGAYPELIEHGVNGILIDKPHQSDEANQQAKDWIRRLTTDHQRRQCIQRAARSVPWSWDLIAQAWEQVFLEQGTQPGESARTLHPSSSSCRTCRGPLRRFIDGERCLSCGEFDGKGSQQEPDSSALQLSGGYVA